MMTAVIGRVIKTLHDRMTRGLHDMTTTATSDDVVGAEKRTILHGEEGIEVAVAVLVTGRTRSKKNPY